MPAPARRVPVQRPSSHGNTTSSFTQPRCPYTATEMRKEPEHPRGGGVSRSAQAGMRGEGGFNRPSRSLLQALPVAFSQMPPSSLITATVEGHESQKKKKKKATQKDPEAAMSALYIIFGPRRFQSRSQVTGK